MDGTGEDEHVLIRGNSSNPGRLVARRFLAAVDGFNFDVAIDNPK